MEENAFSFAFESIEGQPMPLDQYQGKALLVVNTASLCGFTPQYEGLEKLYKEFSGQGLEILAFPCNQFGKQESGSDDEIKDLVNSVIEETGASGLGDIGKVMPVVMQRGAGKVDGKTANILLRDLLG